MRRVLAPAFSLFAGLMMMIVGVMLMETFGCWSGCNAAEIMELGWVLLPGAVVSASGLAAWRWITRGSKPARWVPLLYVLLALPALAVAGFMLTLSLSDPLEYLVILALGALAAAQLCIAWQLWHPGAP